MRKLFKVFLLVNILLILITLVIVIYSVFDSSINGINRNWLFASSWLGGKEVLVYGLDAVNVYFTQFLLLFLVCSMLGIIPILNLPVITFITKKIKLYKKINSFKILLIPLIACILLHIISFYMHISLLLIIIPYIECIIISYIILYFSKKKGLID